VVDLEEFIKNYGFHQDKISLAAITYLWLSTLALSIFTAKYSLLASKLQCMMTAKEDTKLEVRTKVIFYSQIAYTTVASVFFVYFYIRF
jgi:hypothetical protein